MLIFLTVWAVTFSRGLLLLVLVLAVPSMVQHLAFHRHLVGMLPFVNRLLSIGFDPVIIDFIARHIFGKEKPNSVTIFSALCIYLLLDFGFTSIYSAISNKVQRAFYLSPQPICTRCRIGLIFLTSASAHLPS